MSEAMRYTPSTNYCVTDEAGTREPFGGTEFVLADDFKRVEADLAMSRKIRKYVAFVLTGNEEADVQLAADNSEAENKRLREELSRAALFLALNQVEGYTMESAEDWDHPMGVTFTAAALEDTHG